MLKEFIQHIQETTRPLVKEIDGKTFCISHDGEVVEIMPDIFHPGTLALNSLDALVKLIANEAAETATTLFVTVPDHLTVRCFAKPDHAAREFRQVFYEAKATDVPGWGEKVQMPFEEMQIALRTRFQETADTPYVQKLLSDISTGAKITYNDNGVATTIVTSKGVALQGSETIRPIVTLRPYRTFQEVEQPESTFLIRVSERGISFTEADGGMWKLKARETVKAFVEERLKAEKLGSRIIVAL